MESDIIDRNTRATTNEQSRSTKPLFTADRSHEFSFSCYYLCMKCSGKDTCNEKFLH